MVVGDSVPDVGSVRDTSWLSEAVHRQSLPVTGCLLCESSAGVEAFDARTRSFAQRHHRASAQPFIVAIGEIIRAA